jgi:hypothetical protein
MLCICALFMCVCVCLSVYLNVFVKKIVHQFFLFVANVLSRLNVSGFGSFFNILLWTKSSANLWILNGNTYFYVLLFHFFGLMIWPTEHKHTQKIHTNIAAIFVFVSNKTKRNCLPYLYFEHFCLFLQRLQIILILLSFFFVF